MSSSDFNFSGTVATYNKSSVATLVEESSFFISDLTGDIRQAGPNGFFFRDTRLISAWMLNINGAQTSGLAYYPDTPFSATFVSRAEANPGTSDSTLIVFRRRYVGSGVKENVEIKNYSNEAAYVDIEFFFSADFANLFAVKEGRAKGLEDGAVVTRTVNGNTVAISYQKGATKRSVLVEFESSCATMTIEETSARIETVVPPRESYTFSITVYPVLDEQRKSAQPQQRQAKSLLTATERYSRWQEQVPLIDCDNKDFANIVTKSLQDLGSLRIFDPDYPERAIVAAGAPWFMTIFGRDSLISSYMSLIADPALALGTLQTLARFQGKEFDARNDEEPGRILHEMRFGSAASLSLGGGSVYYGSIDSTPLFVVLLGELRKWGLAEEVVDDLINAADRAMEWIENYGDRDGDGFVEYLRHSDRGLQNQGWKDSFDGVRFDNGEIARPPIALAEVQGYTYMAYLARAYFALELGDQNTFEKYRDKAKELRRRFNERFWIENRGYFAIGLDANKNQIDSMTSNAGQCLFTGIVDEEKATVLVKQLMSQEMFSGWGVRTLSATCKGYNPVSYHCGSVWPHDNALIAAGLMRYGFVEEAHQIIAGMLEAARQEGYRLPELFSGFSKQDLSVVVDYPTSCSPQAWASSSPLLLLRILLRFEPWIPFKKLWLSPILPPGINRLVVDRIPVGDRRIKIEIEGDDWHVSGLGDEIELIKESRTPLTGIDKALGAENG